MTKETRSITLTAEQWARLDDMTDAITTADEIIGLMIGDTLTPDEYAAARKLRHEARDLAASLVGADDLIQVDATRARHLGGWLVTVALKSDEPTNAPHSWESGLTASWQAQLPWTQVEGDTPAAVLEKLAAQLGAEAGWRKAKANV